MIIKKIIANIVGDVLIKTNRGYLAVKAPKTD